MTDIFMAVVVLAVIVGVVVVRSRTATQRKEAITRIEAARAGQSTSPVADLFRDEGVPMPTSIASTLPPPDERDGLDQQDRPDGIDSGNEVADDVVTDSPVADAAVADDNLPAADSVVEAGQDA